MAKHEAEATGIELQPVQDHKHGGTAPDWMALPSNTKEESYNDSVHMERLGKKQEFDRNFKFFSITAFSVVAMNGWIFVPNNSLSALVDGNTGGTIAMYLANFAAFATIIFSLAEMSSMRVLPCWAGLTEADNASQGTNRWRTVRASEFAPTSLQKPLSYTAGWLSVLAWCCGSASGFFLAGTLIQGVIVELHSNYTSLPWRGYLFVFTLATIVLLVNITLSRKLPKLEGVAFVLSLASFASVIIVLWVLSAGRKLSSAEVFQTFTDEGGWESLGLSMLAGQILLVWALTGSDATAHMAEETRNASLVIPRAMVWSYVINGLMVFLMLITYCFVLTDLDAAFDSPTGFPFIQIFATATGSSQGGVALTCVFVVLMVFSVTNYMASCSRQIFAFARDKGLPFNSWIAKVYTRTNCPVHAVLITYSFCILVSLISLGSTVAFNAIISLQLLALIFTYMLTISCLVWRRLRGSPLPRGSWSLGAFGMPTNVFALVYSAYLIVFIAFPTEVPVTLETFNWAPVMFVGVIVLALSYYLLHARKVYEGPVVYVETVD